MPGLRHQDVGAEILPRLDRILGHPGDAVEGVRHRVAVPVHGGTGVEVDVGQVDREGVSDPRDDGGAGERAERPCVDGPAGGEVEFLLLRPQRDIDDLPGARHRVSARWSGR